MNNIFKKGFYIIAVLVLSIAATSCEDDDTQVDEIKGLSFVIATLNLEGTEIGVVPTTVNSNNRIIYSVDFGTTPNVDTDNLATSGPMVTFDYPNEDGAYSITVTASLQGTADVSITKDITITEYIAPTIPTGPGNPLAGTWRVASEVGAIGVGPGLGNLGWFALNEEQITERACYLDDEYIFNDDGTFQNVLGAETWIESWQDATVTDGACGAPVFPHDGSTTAEYTFNEAAGTLTLDGRGAYLGVPKAVNGSELASPGDTPDSVTYIANLDGDVLEIDILIDAGNDAYWAFKLVRDAAPSIVGTWKIASEVGAIGVGPGLGNLGWFSLNEEQITERACYLDDEYIFNEDGTFQNVLGTETWIESWQDAAVTDGACGAPVFPHDGSSPATYTFNEAGEELTLDGRGAYLGVPKAVNGSELGSPGDTPDSVTYIAKFVDGALEIDILIDAGNDAYWAYKLVKQ